MTDKVQECYGKKGYLAHGEFWFIKMGTKCFKQVTYVITSACETSPSKCVEFDFVLAESGRNNIQVFLQYF